MLTRKERPVTRMILHRADAEAQPELVAALRSAGADVLIVDIDPAELFGVTITEVEDDEGPHEDDGWERELGGASDGYAVYSDADPSL